MNFPQEFYILLYTAGITAAIGVPRIVKKHYMPRDLQTEEVVESTLNPAQAKFFAKFDQRMDEIGYRPFLTYRVTNLPGRNLSRAYLSSAEPTLGIVATVTASKGTHASSYCSFTTRFRDGSRLVTRNAENVGHLFDKMPRDVVQDQRAIKDPVELKGRHDSMLAGLNQSGPEFVDRAKYLTRVCELHRKWCEYQESRGLLRWDSVASQFRLTTRTALRGVIDQFNPLGSRFTVQRFILGLLLGAGLPTVVLLKAPQTLSFLGRRLSMGPTSLAMLAFPIAFILGGVIVGAIYKSKSFIWGFILSCIPAIVNPSIGAASLLFSLLMGYSAELTGKFMLARDRVA